MKYKSWMISDAGMLFMLLLLFILPTLRTTAGVGHALPLMIAIVAMINRRRWIFACVLPFVLAVPAVLYYQRTYRVPPGKALWITLFDSSVHEVVEYLSPYYLPLCAWLLVCAVWAAIYLRKPRGLVFRHRGLRCLGLAALAIPLLDAGAQSASASDKVWSVDRYFRHSYPMSVLTGYYAAKSEVERLNVLQKEILKGKAQDVVQKREARRVIVLVIGESARRDHHQVYGYGTATTPLMGGAEDVVAFTDMVSLYPYTADSVPAIVAKRDRSQDSPSLAPDLVSIFNQAGYRTYWLSNQAIMGAADSTIGIYARQANQRTFIRALEGMGSGISFDEGLLPPFVEAMKEDADRKLIVVHLYGSHENAGKRYPASFKRFDRPYDNSILYTDWILSQLKHELESAKGENIMFYVADHGLKVDECDGIVEHYDNKQAFEVPLYIWTSKAWIANHRQAFERMESRVASKITTMNVVDTLVDMADLDHRSFDATSSIASSDFLEKPRWVYGFFGKVDYDKAANDARCHIVSRRLAGSE